MSRLASFLAIDMSLWDQIEADNAVFFDTAEGFGQTVIHVSPSGSEFSFVGNVDEEEFGLPSPGDDRGAMLRRMGRIDVPASLEVVYKAPAGKLPSTFMVGEDVWIAMDSGGRDLAQQTVIVQLIDRKSQKRAT